MIARKPFAVKLVSVAEVTSTFPEPVSWTGAPLKVDLLIVSAGFEERVLAFPRLMAKEAGASIPEVLVGTYQTNPTDNDRRFEELSPLLGCIASRTRTVDADTPKSVLSVLMELRDLGFIQRVAFDISGASSNFIFSVMGALAQVMPHVVVTILYAEAGSYNQAFKNQDASDLELEWPELGVANVWTNELFPGFHHDSARSHIIAFPSLYLSRMGSCLSFCGEAVETLAERNVTWVLPRTTHPDHEWRRERTLEVVGRLLAPISAGLGEKTAFREATRFDCDVLSAAQAARILLNQAEAYPAHNLFVVHMGSKLQAVGAALALSARREISLVYARPKKFIPENYSGGVGELRTLGLGKLDSLVSQLARAGQAAMVCADGTVET